MENNSNQEQLRKLPENANGGAGSILKSAFALGLVVVLGVSLLTFVHHFTKARIADQEQRAVLQQLQQIIPAGHYDNNLHSDFYTFKDESAFPQSQSVTAYRARIQGRPVGVILRFAAMDGYNGRIDLLAGINTAGQLTGVRVTAHKETPGLGDGIEVERSDWILAFNGASLQLPAPERWAVRKDGGDFDQMTGATITPRAVVNAVRRALAYFAAHQQELFDTPSELASDPASDPQQPATP
jgi:electron transport complex protein RnfG